VRVDGHIDDLEGTGLARGFGGDGRAFGMRTVIFVFSRPNQVDRKSVAPGGAEEMGAVREVLKDMVERRERREDRRDQLVGATQKQSVMHQK